MAADNPHASRLVVHVMAAFAEHERDMISKRTKDALAAKKARGAILGNPRWRESIDKATAAATPAPVPPRIVKMILDMRTEGSSLRKIAEELNGLNIATSQQNQWHPQTISRVLKGHNRK